MGFRARLGILDLQAGEDVNPILASFCFRMAPPARENPPTRGLPWPVLLGLAALLVQFWYGSMNLGDHPQADAKFYLAMSEGGPSASPAPYGYRVLAPWLAARLPVDIHLAYRLLTGACIPLVALAFFHLLLAWRIPARAAGLAVLLLLLNKYLVGFESWNFYQACDWLGLLALLVSLHAFKARNWILLAAAFLAGLLARETPILLVPGFLVLGWRDGFRARQWAALGLALLPGLAAAAWLRWHFRLPAEAGYLGLLQLYGVKWFSPVTWVRFFVNGWIPVALVPWIFWRESRDFLQRHPELLLLGAGTLFSASLGGDNERLLPPAIPLVYGLIAYLLSLRPALAPGLFLAATISLPHHLVGPWTLPGRNGTLAFSLLGTALAAAWAWRAARKEASLSDPR